MLSDAVSTPGSADWYLLRLGQQLSADHTRLRDLEKYDNGNHPLPIGNQKMRDTYHRLQKMARSNYTGLVVEAVRERLRPLGFMTGAEGTRTTDAEAWRIWQANSLDAESKLVHHQALALSRSYVIVGPNPDDPKTPFITSEHPCQVIHEADPVQTRKVNAALKTWFDPMKRRHLAIVYLPDGIYYYRHVQTMGASGLQPDVEWNAQSWEADPDEGANGFAPNPIAPMVPVVPFISRRERGGLGEFEDVTDIMDRINVTMLDRLVIQTMQAYRQRWGKGIKVEDEKGNPQRPFDPGADLLWLVEDEAAEFGDFQQADLAGIISAVSGDIRDMAAISRTPPHYLLAGIANVSGDALSTAESGLVSKVRDRQIEFGESWELVMRIVAMYAKSGSLDVTSSIVWADPERRTLSELADAAVKWESAGVPFRKRMELLGFSPQEIDRLVKERREEAQDPVFNNPLGTAPGAAPAAVNAVVGPAGGSTGSSTPAPSKAPAKPTK